MRDMDQLSWAAGAPVETDEPLLVPGRTCWRVERANRFAVIVDAADYFAALKSSILRAKRTVLLIGWDFDTRIKLDPDGGDLEGPSRLGRFLDWVVKDRPDLEVYVLKWDLGIIESIGRGSTPLVILDWISHERIHFKLDGAHPVASAHHQKIVVIDDALAFCGGIDLTADRWDTRDHIDDDPHRVRPTSRRHYGPWHDATTAVDGDVARALGELARTRWKLATGQDVAAPKVESDPWPDGVRPTFDNVDVAIARTVPTYRDQAEVREIEALYLAAIAGAKHAIYIESQYFAAQRIAEAMAARLSEADGPEIVIVNPETAHGWLEEEAMGSARARLLETIGAADRHGRFRIYNPVTEDGKPIYVHAKIMVIDDRLLRIGSSNLNNRSMGYDTECDLALEVRRGPDADAISRKILAFRDDLLAEHLGMRSEDIPGAIEAASGSLIGMIEARRGEGRTLVPFEPPKISVIGEALDGRDFFNPERAARRPRRLRKWIGLVKRR